MKGRTGLRPLRVWIHLVRTISRITTLLLQHRARSAMAQILKWTMQNLLLSVMLPNLAWTSLEIYRLTVGQNLRVIFFKAVLCLNGQRQTNVLMIFTIPVAAYYWLYLRMAQATI